MNESETSAARRHRPAGVYTLVDTAPRGFGTGVVFDVVFDANNLTHREDQW